METVAGIEPKTDRNIKRVFVTGATGYIGSALLHLFTEQNLRISCLVHQSPLSIDDSNIDQYRCDLLEFDWKALKEFQPDVIYHFARIPGKNKAERKASALRNARANEKLIARLESLGNPPLLVFGSGTLVYGDQGEKWTDEATELNPVSFQREYVVAEHPILTAMEKKELPIMIVRPPWIYGDGSWFEWFFWNHMQKKQSVPQFGNGLNFMSLIHIADCAGLIHHIAKHGESGQVYNITGHTPIRQHQFAMLLQNLSGLPLKKYSQLRLWLQFDRAAREALTFSLKSATRHQPILNSYKYKYPALRAGIKSILKKMSNK